MIKICKSCGTTFTTIKGVRTDYCSASCAKAHVTRAAALRMQAQIVNNLTDQLEAAKRRSTNAHH